MCRLRSLGIVLALIVGVSTAFAANKPGYDVRKPAIAPRCEGAAVGEWTMDHAAALSAAKSAGKWTVVMVSGMWWCPYCQPLEEKVLNTSAWTNYVEASGGLYEVVLDFPYRDGRSNWCWLYETNYVKAAGMTMDEAFQAIDSLYAVQDAYALESAATVTVSNWNDTAEITYGKVGYPTMILIRPDGAEAGRITPSAVRNLDVAAAQSYVFAALDRIRAPEASASGVPVPSLREALGQPGSKALLKDVEVRETLVATAGETVIDLNGHGLRVVGRRPKPQTDILKVVAGATVTISGTVEKVSGRFDVVPGGRLVLCGGSYDHDVSAYVAEGKFAARQEDGRWLVRDPWEPHPAQGEYDLVVGVKVACLPLVPTNPAAKVTALGLPSGISLKQDPKSKAYYLSGTPSKEQTVEALFIATCAAYGVATNRAAFNVRKATVLVAPVGDVIGCKVSGGGKYAAGKSVSLKATAAKARKATASAPAQEETVFCGWYADESCDVPLDGLYKKTTYSYVLTPDDAIVPRAVYARFLRTADPAATNIAVSVEKDFWVLTPKVEVDIPVTVESASRYTVKAANLPRGLKLRQNPADATYSIVGAPVNPGELDKPVRLTVVNQTNKQGVVCEFRILVDNYRSPAFPDLANAYDGFIAGVRGSVTVPAAGAKVSGLPNGLKWKCATGEVYGTPSRPGSWLVTFTSGKEKATALFTVYQGGGMDPEHPGVIFDGISVSMAVDSQPAWDGVSPLSFYVGVPQRFVLSTSGLENEPTKISAKNLPSWLKLKRRNVCDEQRKVVGYAYVLEGTPTAAMTARTVSLNGSNKFKWTGGMSFTVEVRPLPAWASGDFVGDARSGLSCIGSGSFSVKTSGKTSGRLKVGSDTLTFATSAFSAYDAKNNEFLLRLPLKLSGMAIKTVDARLQEDPQTGLGLVNFVGEDDVWNVQFVQNAWKRPELLMPAFPAGSLAIKNIPLEGLKLTFKADGAIQFSGEISDVDGRLLKTNGSSQVIFDMWDGDDVIARAVIAVPPKEGRYAGFCGVASMRLVIGLDGKVAAVVGLAFEE